MNVGILIAMGQGEAMFAVVGILTIFFSMGIMALVLRCYVKVGAGQALIINKMHLRQVTFSGSVVIPTIHKAEVMDVTVKDIEIERKDNTALLTKDDQRIRGKFVFSVGVNHTEMDVLKVADSVGCERANDPKEIRKIFEPVFNDALETLAAKTTQEEMLHEREKFREEVIMMIGADLNGFVLENFVVHHMDKA